MRKLFLSFIGHHLALQCISLSHYVNSRSLIFL